MKIKGSEIESTPCSIVEVTLRGEVIAVFNAYWTANRGTYGYQIASCGRYTDGNGNLEQFEHKTDGCGYCKETAAFEDFCRLVGVAWRYGGTLRSCTRRGKAGNYQKIALGTLKRLAKG